MANDKQKILARHVKFLPSTNKCSDVEDILAECVDFYDKHECRFFDKVKKVLIIICDKNVTDKNGKTTSKY